jgi:hypothetical protein
MLKSTIVSAITRSIYLVFIGVLMACDAPEALEKPEMFEEVLHLEKRPVDPPSQVVQAPKTADENIDIDYDFKAVVRSENIGKEIITGDEKEARYFTNYLGEIKVGESRFHLVTQYIEIQCAIHKRGRSRIIFLRSPNEIFKVYTEMSQDDLPIAIKKNQLVYRFNNKEVYQSLGNELLEGFCIPDDRGCY